MNVLKHALGVAVAFAGLSLSAGSAKADYICEAWFSPLDTLGKGNNGFVQFYTYSGPDCTGSYLNFYNLCSTGATSSQCINNSSFHYTSAELLATWDAVRDALALNLRVGVPGNACIGGSGFCAGYVYLEAN